MHMRKRESVAQLFLDRGNRPYRQFVAFSGEVKQTFNGVVEIANTRGKSGSESE